MELVRPPALLIPSHLEERAFPAILTVPPAPEALSINATRALRPVPFSHRADAFLHALAPSFWTPRRQAAGVAMGRVLRALVLVPMHVWHVLTRTRYLGPEPVLPPIARPLAASYRDSVSVFRISSRSRSRTPHHNPRRFPLSRSQYHLKVEL